MRRVDLNEKAKDRVMGMVELRGIVNELIEYQLEDYPDEMITQKQAELNDAYDAFAAKNGLINNRANGQALITVLFPQPFSPTSKLSPLENLTSILSENILKFCIDNFERYMVISSSTHKSCYIVHSDFIIQFLLIHINSIRNLFMPKECDAIDPT